MNNAWRGNGSCLARSALTQVSALLVVLSSGCGAPPPGEVTVRDDGTVEVPAIVSAAEFERSDMAGYHLVVWQGGRAIDAALLRASVTDVQLLEALIAVGADPGNALRIDAWDDRYEESSSAPDGVIEGSAIDVTVALPDGRELGLHELLEDGGERGFEMRFGGHRDNIEHWHSGCLVCLYSCPGSKVGNARYTVRDFVAGATHFRPKPGVLPPDGTEVTVRFRVIANNTEMSGLPAMSSTSATSASR